MLTNVIMPLSKPASRSVHLRRDIVMGDYITFSVMAADRSPRPEDHRDPPQRLAISARRGERRHPALRDDGDHFGSQSHRRHTQEL